MCADSFRGWREYQCSGYANFGELHATYGDVTVGSLKVLALSPSVTL